MTIGLPPPTAATMKTTGRRWCNQTNQDEILIRVRQVEPSAAAKCINSRTFGLGYATCSTVVGYTPGTGAAMEARPENIDEDAKVNTIQQFILIHPSGRSSSSPGLMAHGMRV